MIDAPVSPAGQAAPNGAAGLRRLGDVQDVATMLDCSTKYVRRLTDAGKIPGVVRLGRLLRFDLDLIGRWIDQSCPPIHRFVKGNRHD